MIISATSLLSTGLGDRIAKFVIHKLVGYEFVPPISFVDTLNI